MPRILLIDDDLIVRAVIREALVQAGYEVIEASDGKMGLALYAATRPELIITDLVMPETEGLEVLMTLRSRHSKTKVIVISGGVRGCDCLQAAKLLGAHAVLAKPFSLDELLAPVARLAPLTGADRISASPCGVPSHD